MNLTHKIHNKTKIRKMAKNKTMQESTLTFKEKKQEIEILKKIHKQEIEILKKTHEKEKKNTANKIKELVGQIRRLYNIRIRKLEQELKKKDESLCDLKKRIEKLHETQIEMSMQVKNALANNYKSKKKLFFKKILK